MKAVRDFSTLTETKRNVSLCLVLVLAVLSTQTLGQDIIDGEGTTLESSLTQPVIITEGQDALLTCVAKNLGEHTVLWKYGRDKILTAGSTRISSDQRFSVLTDEGGDVFVLSIKEATHTDTGLYICEVNTDPPARSFHKLTVLTDKLVAPLNSHEHDTTSDNSSASIALWGFSTPSPIDHDYSDCCTKEGVSSECMGFCSIKNILEGTTGNHPANCDDQFKKIVHCMADGKNHVPCCQRAQVPDVCQDMCIGEYTVQTEDVRTHISCAAYTAPTLACIAEGVNILPSRPTEVEALTVTDLSMTIQWTLPPNAQSNPDRFYLNVTKERKFTPENEDSEGSSLTSTQSTEDNTFKTYTIPGDKRNFSAFNLEPFTYYTIVLTSENIHGLSLPSYKLKILTLSTKEAESQKQNPGSSKKIKDARTPSLPDVKQCCNDGKVGHESCVDTFCDPLSAKKASVPDLMICAPWSQTMFGCLADGKDHSDCCESRGVPEICEPMCSGNATSVNFRHFKCMEYMHEITNCILRGYGVLPSEPRNFRFSNVGHNVGLLHWDQPLQLAETVTSYKVTFIRISPNDPTEQREIENIKGTTYILEDLIPNSSYEVFVEAANAHGFGDPSTRIVFRTANPPKTEQKFTGYDQSFCCKTIGVRDECMPLCEYNMTTSTISQLTTTCSDEFAKITKCAAGGRDHLPCCTRRGVSEECHAICQGLQYDPSSSIFTSCASYIGNIMMCLEEGVDKFPDPVTDFHALYVSDSEVELAWEPVLMPDKDEEVVHYEIYFKELKNNSDSGSPFDHESNINTTQPMFTVTGLKTNTKYRFFVIARNVFGTSLPSSVVTVNVSKEAWDGTRIEGLPSSPHAIDITQTGADYLTLSWTAPTISHHQDEHKYKLYYGVASNATKDSLVTVETSATSVQLKNLTPNTPYVIYMTAVGEKGESEPSETVVTWTEPIVPAFAEAPAVHPRTGLVEGGSMTILCIALGTPTPRITLYLGGHPIRSEATRHLVTTIYNVTKDMAQISCYADNGYGTPMQTSRTIDIEHKPYVKGPTQTRIVRYVGQDLTVMCTVDAFPAPVMSMGRIGGYLTASGDRIKMVTQSPSDNPENKYAVGMTISDVQVDDGGNYYCKGNNTHGDDTQHFQIVIVDGSHKESDVMSCCKEQNVTDSCLGICSSHQIDVDLLLYSPQCIPELDKLMSCGSDGSDHRHCCSNAGVPRSCLDWCRGQPVEETEPCALSFAPQIAKCFHEGQYTLPGPPRNIRVTPKDAHSAVASWDPPNKNADFVELYRILWRKEGAKLAKKIDTSETSINIDELIPGVTYELVIKAGNSNGTSQLTPPIKFITADKYIIEAKVYNQTPSIIGALVAVLLLLLIIGFGVWYFRGNKTIIRNLLNTSNDRSFTNPFFNQEVTMSHLQQDQPEMTTGSPDVLPPTPYGLEPIQEQTEQGEQRSVLSRLGLQVPGFAFQRFQ